MPTFAAFNPRLVLVLAACGAASTSCLAGPPLVCYTPSFADQLLALDGAVNDQFGQVIAATDDFVVVGVPLDDNAGGLNAGAVYVWARVGDAWLFQQKLLTQGAAPNDRFGQSVAIVGHTIIVGAPLADEVAADVGAVYVFSFFDGAWDEQAVRILAQDRVAGDRFGSAVAFLDDNLIAIGAPNEEDQFQSDRGAVYTFTSPIAGLWVQQQKLVAADGFNGDQFGAVLAADGGVLAVAAPMHDVPTRGDAGQVYLFESNGGEWSFRQALTAGEPQSNANFGGALAIKDNLILVGARRDLVGGVRTGAAYVFTPTADVWQQRQKLTPPGGQFDDAFGSAVAIAGQNLFVGASNADPPFFPNTGLGYLFAPGPTMWNFQGTFAPPKPSLGMAFGSAAATSSDRVFWGAPLDNAGFPDAGSILAFEYLTTAPAIIDQPDNVRTCRVMNVSFSIQFQDDGSPQFLWRRDGVPLDDGPTPSGSVLSGVYTTTLNIFGAGPADAALYDVAVTNACGPTISAAATLVVCVADWTCDGTVNSTDVSDFINAWFEDVVQGTLETDVDANGVVNSTDVSEFINRWFGDVAAGC